ncbi:CCR4-NOT transcription complex subunit 3-like isoform X2 [Anneissia japonica]|uniref:CCR4-NOT transcription complex subunit 3-like isoform X2 n=1 Tax=Anneissia japonica TaxID=1529436 RepID=UPI001425622F|nr:CCR4-NOT transcription complex subunit 3-like isoform X2 [Anneissia japonica]
MGDKRKLQGEIERCLKKVSEGVETFEDIWQKVQSATNSNQKDKCEGELKKEIKKLQRLRDQIKTWVASNDIKDKRTLLDNRKLIETQMERFKVVERETKTKAYSKEGLGLATRIDPVQREREEVSGWLSQCIDTLKIQVDRFESEMESMTSNSKKRKIPSDKQDRLNELQNLIERHNGHVKKLEMIMRMLDNTDIETEKVKQIKEDLEYYLDSCQDPDFAENEYLYDDFEFEEHDYGLSTLATSPEDGEILANAEISSSPIASSPIVNHSKERDEEKKRHRSTESEPSPRKAVAKTNNAPSPSNSNNNGSRVRTLSSSSSSSSSQATSIVPNTSKNANSKANNNSSAHTIAQPPVGPAYSVAASSQNTQQGFVLSEQHIEHEMFDLDNGNSMTVTGLSNSITVPQPQPPIQTQVPHIEPTRVINNMPTMPTPPSAVQMNGPIPPTTISNKEDNSMKLKTIAQKAVVNAGLDTQIQPPEIPTENRVTAIYDSTPRQEISSPQTQETKIPALLGVTPLGPQPLSKDHAYQLAMMEAAAHHLPHPSDSERLRHYLPRNPCPTPTYHCPAMPPHMDSLDFYARLSTEALFFIFYYQEGTKAQYLAAKALKKQSWRFHTKYMMWFQRHEEPKTITDEYEQGTYIYFDYEKWGQRKKEGFTFEYRYLEDRDL